MKVIRLGLSLVSLLPVVRGLVSEAAKVRGVLQRGTFDAVALSISPEELETLAENPEVQAPSANIEEEVYMRELGRFGPVAKPPPCFVEALKSSTALGLDCLALDMSEEEFTEMYCQHVRGWHLLRYSRDMRKLLSMSFPATSPEEFVRAFDAVVNRRRPYARLESAREEHMAQSLGRLSISFRKPLAIVEVERYPGVVDRLNRPDR